MISSKKNYLFFCLFTLLLFSSCDLTVENLKQKGSSIIDPEEYYQFKEIDLRQTDLEASIFIPDETAGIGASFKANILHDEDFKWLLSAGPNFELFIEDYGDFNSLMSEFRAKIKSKHLFKISIIKDQDSLVIYKREIINNRRNHASRIRHESYHIYGVKRINGYNYEIKNRESGNTLKVVKFMEKSIKSLKLNSQE